MDVNLINQSECFIKKKKHLDKVDENSTRPGINVSPSEIKFTFTPESFKVQKRMIEITNYYSKSCPIQILPLNTSYFRVENSLQRSCLTPGSVFKTNIYFAPDEVRDYNDILRIRYSNDQLLQVRIIAKIASHFSFPASISFGNVPLGRAACYKIPIYSYAEKHFSFAILPSKEDPSVDIYPRWGSVRPGQKPVTVMVIYRPLRYVSMNFEIRILLSDFCKVPYTIHFYAHTRPGLLRDSLKSIEPEVRSKVQPIKADAVPKKIKKSPSRKENATEACAKESRVKRAYYEDVILKQCSYIPPYTLHAINCIINSKIRRPYGEYELRGPLRVYTFETMNRKMQKLKEFFIKAENYRRENEYVRMHYKPKSNYRLRDPDSDRIIEIKLQREQTWNDYENSKMSLEDELFERPRAMKIRQRILRVARKYPNTTSTSIQNRESLVRYSKILPFLQAARKIVLKNRLVRVLEKLKRIARDPSVTSEQPLVQN